MTTQTDSIVEPLYSTLATDPDMAELVEMFVADMPLHVAAMETAIKVEDWTGLQRLAHRLKGSSPGYGFATVGASAGALEIALNYSDREVIMQRAERLLFQCRRIRN